MEFLYRYLEFRNGGHHIDARDADGTGRKLYLNYNAKQNVVFGNISANSTTYVNGNLHVRENTGTRPSAGPGTGPGLPGAPPGPGPVLENPARPGQPVLC